jgi:hypothetical protein
VTVFDPLVALVIVVFFTLLIVLIIPGPLTSGCPCCSRSKGDEVSEDDRKDR